MVFKCAALGCKSGYKNHVPEGISFHKFPNNCLIRARWLRKLSRSNYQPTKNSRICSLHFYDSDFITQRSDSNPRRLKTKSAIRQLKKLKPEAVPSRFSSDVPSYLNSPPKTVRTLKSTSQVRKTNDEHRLNSMIAEFESFDTLNSLFDIQQKFSECDSKPDGFILHRECAADEDRLNFLLLSFDINPKIIASVTFSADLSLTVFIDNCQIPWNKFSSVLSSNKVSLFSEVINLLASVKSVAHKEASKDDLLDSSIYFLSLLIEKKKDASLETRSLEFLLEQLQLQKVTESGRRYSPSLLIFSFVLRSISTSAYSNILDQKILILPSIRVLQKLSSRVSSKSGLTDSKYLSLRRQKLNDFEEKVMLLVDEIYISKRIEMANGSIVGATGIGNGVPSTVLCFMIKSLASKYRDVVSMYPMCSLTSVKLRDCFNETLRMVSSSGFHVVAVSLDNLAANSLFYKQLCGGTDLLEQISNPVTHEPLFLMFDNVHNFKNLYNNFLKRRNFKCPKYKSILENECSPSFDHIKDLYNHESGFQLRKAFKLSAKSIEPKNLEKTSVKLANAVFCESTRDALHYYSNQIDMPWRDTAEFVGAITKFWCITNVREPTAGKKLRDINRDPVTSTNDWKLIYLQEFADFLTTWENSKQQGLTRETFQATRHTCKTMISLAKYLLNSCNFRYVLLGRLVSDPLEQRFGWYRQCSGANYFISFKQLLDSERKIKVISLIKYSNYLPQDLDQLSGNKENPDLTLSENFISEFNNSVIPVLEECEMSTIYYCAGALSRSILNCTHCSGCRCLLVSDDPLEIESAEENFFPLVDRGGLLRPTTFAYHIGIKAYLLFRHITKSSLYKVQFLSSFSQRDTFLHCLSSLLELDQDFETFLPSSACENGHPILKYLIQKFFNTLSKNFMHKLTDMQRKSDIAISKKSLQKSNKLSSIN